MVLPLDLAPGALAAYGMRRLRAAYSGPAIRVYRDSDSTEQDIGFDGDDLDDAAITAFVGSSNGRISTWYDQSGNDRHATQSNQNDMPLLAVSGVYYTLGGKKVLGFEGAFRRQLNVASIPVIDGSDVTFIQTFRPDAWQGSNPGMWRSGASSSGNHFMIFQGTTGRPWIRWGSAGTNIFQPSSGYSVTLGEPLVNTWNVVSATSYEWRANGDTKYSGSHAAATAAFSIESFFHQSGQYVSGLYADTIWYPYEISGSTRDSLESEIGAYYGIMDPPVELSSTGSINFTPTEYIQQSAAIVTHTLPVRASVIFKTSSATQQALFQVSNGTSASYYLGIFIQADGTVRATGNYLATGLIATTANTYNDGNWHIASLVITPSGPSFNISLKVDGETVSGSVRGIASATSFNRTTVGYFNHASPANPLNGNIAALISANTNDSFADHDTLYNGGVLLDPAETAVAATRIWSFTKNDGTDLTGAEAELQEINSGTLNFTTVSGTPTWDGDGPFIIEEPPVGLDRRKFVALFF